MRLWLLTAIPKGEQERALMRGKQRKLRQVHEGVPAKAIPHKSVRGQITLISSKEICEAEGDKYKQEGYVITIRRWKPPY